MSETVSGLQRKKRSSDGDKELYLPTSPTVAEAQRKAQLVALRSMYKRRAKEPHSAGLREEPSQAVQASKSSSIKRSWEEASGERRAPPKTSEAGGGNAREEGALALQGSEDGGSIGAPSDMSLFMVQAAEPHFQPTSIAQAVALSGLHSRDPSNAQSLGALAPTSNHVEDLAGMGSPLPGHSRVPSSFSPRPPGGPPALNMAARALQQQQGLGGDASAAHSRMPSDFLPLPPQHIASQQGSVGRTLLGRLGALGGGSGKDRSHLNPGASNPMPPLQQPEQQQQQAEGATSKHSTYGSANRNYVRVSSGGSYYSEDDGFTHLRTPSNYLPLPPSSDVLISALAANDPRRARNLCGLAAGADLAQQQQERQLAHVGVGTEEGVQTDLPHAGGSINCTDDLGQDTTVKNVGSDVLLPTVSNHAADCGSQSEDQQCMNMKQLAHSQRASDLEGHMIESPSSCSVSPTSLGLPPLQAGGGSLSISLDATEDKPGQPGQEVVAGEQQGLGSYSPGPGSTARSSSTAPTPHFRRSVKNLDPAHVSYTEIHAPRSPSARKAAGDYGNVLMGSPLQTQQEAELSNDRKADLSIVGHIRNSSRSSTNPQQVPVARPHAANARTRLAPPSIGNSQDLMSSRPQKAMRKKPAPMPPPEPPVVEGPTEAQVAAAKFRAATQEAARKSRAAAAAAAAKRAAQQPAPPPPPPSTPPPPPPVVTKMDVLARIQRANKALHAHKSARAAKRHSGDGPCLPPAACPVGPPAAASPSHDRLLLKQSRDHTKQLQQQLLLLKKGDQRGVRFEGDEDGQLGQDARKALPRKSSTWLNRQNSSGGSEGFTSGGENREGEVGDAEGEDESSKFNRATSPLFDLPRLLSRKDSCRPNNQLRRLSMVGGGSRKARSSTAALSRYSTMGSNSNSRRRSSTTDDLSAILQKPKTSIAESTQPQAPPAVRLQQLYAAQAKAKVQAAQQARAAQAADPFSLTGNADTHNSLKRSSPWAKHELHKGGKAPRGGREASAGKAWHTSSVNHQNLLLSLPAASTQEPAEHASPNSPFAEAVPIDAKAKQFHGIPPKGTAAGDRSHGGEVDLALLGAGVVVPQTIKSSAMHEYYHRLLQQQVQRQRWLREERQLQQELECTGAVGRPKTSSSPDARAAHLHHADTELATAIQARRRAQAHSSQASGGDGREPWVGASTSTTPPRAPRTSMTVFSMPRSLSNTSSSARTRAAHSVQAPGSEASGNEDRALSEIDVSFRRTTSLGRSGSVNAHARPLVHDLSGISPDEVLKSLLRRGDPPPRAVPPKPHSSTLGLPPHLTGFQGTTCSASYHRQLSAGKQGSAAATENMPRYAIPTANWVAKMGPEEAHAHHQQQQHHHQLPPWAPPGPNPTHHNLQEGHHTLARAGCRRTTGPSEDGMEAGNKKSACTKSSNIKALVRDILASRDAAAAGLTAELLAQLGLLPNGQPLPHAGADNSSKAEPTLVQIEPQGNHPPQQQFQEQQQGKHLQPQQQGQHARVRSADAATNYQASRSDEDEAPGVRYSAPHSANSNNTMLIHNRPSNSSTNTTSFNGTQPSLGAGSKPGNLVLSHGLDGISRTTGQSEHHLSNSSSFSQPSAEAVFFPQNEPGSLCHSPSGSGVRLYSPLQSQTNSQSQQRQQQQNRFSPHSSCTSVNNERSSMPVLQGGSHASSVVGEKERGGYRMLAEKALSARQRSSSGVVAHRRSTSLGHATATVTAAQTAGRGYNKAFSTSSACILEGRQVKDAPHILELQLQQGHAQHSSGTQAHLPGVPDVAAEEDLQEGGDENEGPEKELDGAQQEQAASGTHQVPVAGVKADGAF